MEEIANVIDAGLLALVRELVARQATNEEICVALEKFECTVLSGLAERGAKVA